MVFSKVRGFGTASGHLRYHPEEAKNPLIWGNLPKKTQIPPSTPLDKRTKMCYILRWR
ncbi:hypothetical protein HRbin15_01645 [bacterium HR15]|nr:hypothetical protein HRbin15_01645 [bacterium HR15]